MAALAATAAIATTSAAMRRWPLAGTAFRAQVLEGIERSSGLSASASGRMTVRFLPRPVVEVHGVSLRGLSGAVALDADLLRGRLAIGPLLRGELQVAGASFENPTVALDVDRLEPIVAALLGRSGAPPSLALFHTGGLTLHGGVVRLMSQDRHRDSLVTDLNITADWPSDAAGASLAGSGTWRGINGAFGIEIASPAEALRGGQTLASAHVRSTAVDASLEGTLSGGGDRQASGKVMATTHDLPAFLRAIGMPTPQLDSLRQARLSGSATLTGDTLSFDPATLDLDAMTFEGALAMHQRDGRTGLAGTLATDRIELDPFLDALPLFLSPDGRWSDATLGTSAVAYDDIDLRISASTAKLRTIAMEDGSLSLQSGDGRMELSLGEAHAYDGLLKGRIVATIEGAQTDIRADATLSRLDLKALLKDVPGDYSATGTISSHIALEARGSSPAELAGSLGGRGELSVRDGEIGTKLLTAVVQAAPSAAAPSLPLLVGGAAPFDLGSFDFTVEHGKASLNDSWITWPSLRAAIEGSADLPNQYLDVRARLIPETSEDAPDAQSVYSVKGSWHDLLMKPARPDP